MNIDFQKCLIQSIHFLYRFSVLNKEMKQLFMNPVKINRFFIRIKYSKQVNRILHETLFARS